jgi:hypothetical protein
VPRLPEGSGRRIEGFAWRAWTGSFLTSLGVILNGRSRRFLLCRSRGNHSPGRFLGLFYFARLSFFLWYLGAGRLLLRDFGHREGWRRFSGTVSERKGKRAWLRSSFCPRLPKPHGEEQAVESKSQGSRKDESSHLTSA